MASFKNIRLAALLAIGVAMPAAAQVTLTFPTASQTIVGRTTTDTLTGKTIDCTDNTCLNFPGGGSGASQITLATGTGSISTTTGYLATNGSSTAAGAREIPVAQDGTLSDMLCYTDSVPGAGATHTYTLVVNGSANTNQEVTTVDTNNMSTTATNVGVAVTRGQRLAARLVSTAAVSTGVRCVFKFVAS